MIVDRLAVAGIIVALAGCSPSKYPATPSDDVAESPITISGTAVTGVIGGSGQSTRMVSEVKDLQMSVGLSLGGR